MEIISFKYSIEEDIEMVTGQVWKWKHQAPMLVMSLVGDYQIQMGQNTCTACTFFLFYFLSKLDASTTKTIISLNSYITCIRPSQNVYYK
jgi:hypothetical protein